MGYWDSVAYKFAAGEKMYMEEWKARHFAKHLANRELLRVGRENDTSPKVKPNGETDNPIFNEYFYKAIIDTEHVVDESRAVTDALNLNLNKEEVKEEKPKKRIKKVKQPEKSDEDNFEGLK